MIDEKIEYKVTGYDCVQKRVGATKSSGQIYVPASWIGLKTMVVLLEDSEDGI